MKKLISLIMVMVMIMSLGTFSNAEIKKFPDKRDVELQTVDEDGIRYTTTATGVQLYIIRLLEELMLLGEAIDSAAILNVFPFLRYREVIEVTVLPFKK